jgi:transposase-like protein
MADDTNIEQSVEQLETPQETCPKCGSDDIANEDAPSEGVFHVTCHGCGYQWTEPAGEDDSNE